MRHNTFLILAVAMFLCSCSETGELREEVVGAALETSEIFTLEFAIGGADDNRADEFLIVEPWFKEVSYNDDIFILDEELIKVYNASGKSKQIVGGSGYGPGEYRGNNAFCISPEGYVTIFGKYGAHNCTMTDFEDGSFIRTGLGAYYHLFAPDFSFIKTEKFQNIPGLLDFLSAQGVESPELQFVSRFYVLNPEEKVYQFMVFSPTRDASADGYRMLVHEKSGQFALLYKSKIPVPSRVQNLRNYHIWQYILGCLHWDVLPGKRLVFIDTAADIINKQGTSLYIVNVVSLETGKVDKLNIEFQPLPFPESLLKLPDTEGYDDAWIEREKLQVEAAKNKKCFPSVMRIKTDGDDLLLFPYNARDYNEIRGTAYEYRNVEIIDIATGNKVSETEFPIVPFTVRNGFAYTVNVDDDRFYEIRKYRINPAVYNK